MSYPSWRYHKTEEPKIILSKEEEHKDWKDNAGKFLPKDHFEYVPESSDESAPTENQIIEDLKIEPIKEVKPKKKK